MEYIADRSVRLYFRVIMATVWRVLRRIAGREGDTLQAPG
jgi:hypothetical protein